MLKISEYFPLVWRESDQLIRLLIIFQLHINHFPGTYIEKLQSHLRDWLIQLWSVIFPSYSKMSGMNNCQSGSWLNAGTVKCKIPEMSCSSLFQSTFQIFFPLLIRDFGRQKYSEGKKVRAEVERRIADKEEILQYDRFSFECDQNLTPMLQFACPSN